MIHIQFWKIKLNMQILIYKNMCEQDGLLLTPPLLGYYLNLIPLPILEHSYSFN